MSDRELLELAAKAAGIALIKWSEEWSGEPGVSGYLTLDGDRWNPLTDDGDAFRLAVKLGIMICRRININGQFAVAEAEGRMFCPEPWFPDPYAANRRAITRAAAEVQREKENKRG